MRPWQGLGQFLPQRLRARREFLTQLLQTLFVWRPALETFDVSAHGSGVYALGAPLLQLAHARPTAVAEHVLGMEFQ